MKDIIMMIVDDFLEEECPVHKKWTKAIFFKSLSAHDRVLVYDPSGFDLMYDLLGSVVYQDDFWTTLASILAEQRREEALLN